MRVKIVSGKDAGTVREYDDAAAQSLLDAGFAVPVPPSGPPVALEATPAEPTPLAPEPAEPEKPATRPKARP